MQGSDGFQWIKISRPPVAPRLAAPLHQIRRHHRSIHDECLYREHCRKQGGVLTSRSRVARAVDAHFSFAETALRKRLPIN